MRSLFPMLAVVMSAVALAAPTQAEGFADHGSVTAKRAGGKVTIVVKGKGDFHVNLDYPIKVELGAAKLGKAEGKYEGIHDGKADSVTFETTDGASKGKVKAVFCDQKSCTAPLSTEFDVR